MRSGHLVGTHRWSKGERAYTATQQREAMGMPWETVDDLTQAVPPAYSEFIGRAFMGTPKKIVLS